MFILIFLCHTISAQRAPMEVYVWVDVARVNYTRSRDPAMDTVVHEVELEFHELAVRCPLCGCTTPYCGGIFVWGV